jgi:tol-pal system protein YbgF
MSARLSSCLGRIAAALLIVCSLTAQAALFEDDEARRAILEARERIEAVRQDAEQRVSQEARRSAEENAQLRSSLLELQNQLEQNRAEQARLRGQIEQLARDLSELQRKQKDGVQALEDRLRKFEPSKVVVDGREFMADPTEKRDYEINLAMFRKADFASAAIGFVDFLNRNPQTGYRPSALFWLGNAQYANKDYKSAQANFRALITAAPDHIRVPEALLAIANCQLEAKDTKGARKTLESLVADYPDSEAASAAKDRLARFK